jgi:hypothetical protein
MAYYVSFAGWKRVVRLSLNALIPGNTSGGGSHDGKQEGDREDDLLERHFKLLSLK